MPTALAVSIVKSVNGCINYIKFGIHPDDTLSQGSQFIFKGRTFFFEITLNLPYLYGALIETLILIITKTFF